MGFFAAVVFVAGLFSANSYRNGTFPENKPMKTVGVIPDSNLVPGLHRISYRIIDKNRVNRIELTVETGLNSTSGKISVVAASAYLFGSTSGFRWEPILLAAEATKDQEITYRVSGTLNWKLFGVTVYNEPKHIIGTLEIKAI
ncbi:hypothetical protein ACFPMF_01540 [Larkinella bovis]|uniref:Uncharacterized protein n=1 Tax=Larkinella bovis TaxID=683041 RepID=A0ABW0I612_9BACT